LTIANGDVVFFTHQREIGSLIPTQLQQHIVLRRMNPGLVEASMDLGANVWQTFRLVTFPQFRPAFVAGAILAFALSFDEVIVTIFTAPPGVETLPLWILKEMARPNQASVVNVVATVVILLSLIPVYESLRMSRSDEDV